MKYDVSTQEGNKTINILIEIRMEITTWRT